MDNALGHPVFYVEYINRWVGALEIVTDLHASYPTQGRGHIRHSLVTPIDQWITPDESRINHCASFSEETGGFFNSLYLFDSTWHVLK